jgi:hypothetical protein
MTGYPAGDDRFYAYDVFCFSFVIIWSEYVITRL